MGLKHKYDIVHTRKYTTKEGEEKKAYTKIGAVFERDDGSLCMKLLDSWVNFYEPKIGERESNQIKKTGQNTQFEDEIPF